MYYKLEALAKSGVEITLHCFEHRRKRQEILEKVCKKVYYYPRNSVVKSVCAVLPFIVTSRANSELIARLQEDKYPILFEGIHTTFPLLTTDLSDRITLVRMHNIEHDYYNGLAKSERNIFKKIFFKLEAKKLKYYEKHLSKSDYILAISPAETAYYQALFGKKVVFIPPFHENTQVAALSQKGDFAFYHGDLSISDNYQAVLFLMDIFKDMAYPLVIGGSFFPKKLQDKIEAIPQVSWLDISDNAVLKEAFSKAHINVLLSFQKTGIKLKLINALYQSRFVLGNHAILDATGLENIATLADTKTEIRQEIQKIIHTDYTAAHIQAKEKSLAPFQVKGNAAKIIELL